MDHGINLDLPTRPSYTHMCNHVYNIYTYIYIYVHSRVFFFWFYCLETFFLVKKRYRTIIDQQFTLHIFDEPGAYLMRKGSLANDGLESPHPQDLLDVSKRTIGKEKDLCNKC